MFTEECSSHTYPPTPCSMHPLISNSSGIFNPTLKFGADCDYLPIYSLSPSSSKSPPFPSSPHRRSSLSLSLSLPSDKTLAKYCALRGLTASQFYLSAAHNDRDDSGARIFYLLLLLRRGEGGRASEGEERRHRKNLLMLQLL